MTHQESKGPTATRKDSRKDEDAVRAYERYKRLLVLAHDDLQTLELFERFLVAGQDHFGAVALAKDKGDTLGRMMSALYAINGHLRKNFSDDFPDGFFPG